MTPIEPVSLGISLMAIIAFITPFVYHSKKRKRLELILRQQFFREAQEYGLQLHQYDFWRGQYAIGLDETNRTLLYANSSSPLGLVQLQIGDIKDVYLLKSSRFKGRGREREEIIDRLEIQVVLWNPETVGPRLLFFDGERHSDLLGEGPLAKKWVQIINAQLACPIKN
ncbi:hypothetical protein [Cyclobacterium jeungdonense]|uniref:Uncharacterized protein n=1 Tax=Cyclobacterium jeungdonense TaxID=708087 RepID=A0ABT8CEM2_9BACT|nr:hypothetical protein [Cyclobacterium jeungdonense]MDN3690637.1 hypothetical protein [Cyclobacterium jeungdonense]